MNTGYSLWTNKSFKLPLLGGAVACILGNCLYALGYDSKALWLLLASRLVVGLGKLVVAQVNSTATTCHLVQMSTCTACVCKSKAALVAQTEVFNLQNTWPDCHQHALL